ncbi:recombination protein F [Qipengyuania flava]|nr:recombination protein F [Qipengyuania flava]QYJ06653.1 recombination protein F [Qipengyuania flava]
MSVLDYASNKAVAAVFALSVSAMFMAAAIVPASPAGLIA